MKDYLKENYEDVTKVFYLYLEGVLNYHEFFELIEVYFERPNEEIFLKLKNVILARDETRRSQNILCKPISELDVRNLRKESYSYYKMDPDFPQPICTGRKTA